MGSQVPRRNSDMGMEAFNKQINEADKQIDNLSVLLQNLKEVNEESKAVTEASAMKAIKKRMEKDIGKAGKIAHGVKTRIEAISKENLNNQQKPGCEKGTGIDRIRMNVTNALIKKFMDLLAEFKAEEIQERHGTVKKIEKKAIGLNQIYLDMAVLVEAQGEILDNIESQVNNAADYDQIGTSALQNAEVLQNAEELQKNSRKLMYISIIVLLIAVVIIVVDVLKPWKSSKGA